MDLFNFALGPEPMYKHDSENYATLRCEKVRYSTQTCSRSENESVVSTKYVLVCSDDTLLADPHGYVLYVSARDFNLKAVGMNYTWIEQVVKKECPELLGEKNIEFELFFYDEKSDKTVLFSKRTKNYSEPYSAFVFTGNAETLNELFHEMANNPDYDELTLFSRTRKPRIVCSRDEIIQYELWEMVKRKELSLSSFAEEYKRRKELEDKSQLPIN